VVGVVSQETYLLHTTVRENLRYARPGATDAQIEAAARAARIHDLIAGLPDGYDTVVGSAGTGSPAARSSAWPSPARCCATPGC
jgi:ATP-binding cassette subfamily B protein